MSDTRDIIDRLNGVAGAKNFGGYPADRRTLTDAVAEIRMLRQRNKAFEKWVNDIYRDFHGLVCGDDNVHDWGWIDANRPPPSVQDETAAIRCAECGFEIKMHEPSYYERATTGDFGRTLHSRCGDPLGIKAAVLAEREACANIIDDAVNGYWHRGGGIFELNDLPSRIRNRKEE